MEIRTVISRLKETSESLKKAKGDYDYQYALYTGVGQESVLLNYRVMESEPQKKQRKRIYIPRTKHIVRQAENVLDQLDIMDKPSIKIIGKNENEVKDIEAWIYNNNIAALAYNYTKHANLIDANAILVCTESEDNVSFKMIMVSDIIHIEVVNGVTDHIVVKSKDGKYFDHYVYSKDSIHIIKDEKRTRGEGEIIGGQEVVVIDTGMPYYFRLGYVKDISNQMQTFLSLLEPASELFRSIIWQGSELDNDVATHGIVKLFAYANVCNNTVPYEEGIGHCSGGSIYIAGDYKEKCQSCNGSGMQIHTSSQDLITYPMPADPQTAMKLADLTHTVFAPSGFLDFRKTLISELKEEIMKTIFNSTTITKDQISQTATGEMIDLQGIYSTLNQLGKAVSEAFIWMCECYANKKGYKNIEFIHGYTLSLKLENVETLAIKKKNLVEAGAPSEIIRAIDMAMLQKQHIDSPNAIREFAIWENYRPFNDKSENVIMTILAGLPNDNKYKILYNFFATIKSWVKDKYGDAFFNAKHVRRVEILDEAIELIRQDLTVEQQQPILGF